MGILGKKSKKSKGDELATKACCDDCKQVEDRKLYKVIVVLNKDKCYNTELNKWLFNNPLDEGKILVLNGPEAEFNDADGIWRFTDRFYNGIYDSLTIKQVK